MFGLDDQSGDNGAADQTSPIAPNDPNVPVDQPMPTVAAVGPDAANAWDHPGEPLDTVAASAPAITPPSAAQASVAPTAVPTAASPTADDLVAIKQHALEQLSPLVGHLDQDPEEKFRTLMMMIQASDDQSKINEAYQAALAIGDEKARAQALLDVINEINYFTQPHQS